MCPRGGRQEVEALELTARHTRQVLTTRWELHRIQTVFEFANSFVCSATLLQRQSPHHPLMDAGFVLLASRSVS